MNKIKEIHDALILGIRDYFKKNNFQKAVIGLSGGIDSSVAAYLVVKALRNKNVTALLMPELGVTSQENIEDAKDLAKELKIRQYIIPINEVINLNIIKNVFSSRMRVSEFVRHARRARLDSLAMSLSSLAHMSRKNVFAKVNNNIQATANVKARMRMIILYYFANLNNALVIGTSDKSEIALGYTTKYGDSAADILIIGDLWKTEVIEMGRFLSLPNSILRKKSTAELIIGQTAEKELGAEYEVLDKILKMYIEKDLSINKIINKGFDRKIVKNVVDRIRLNEHKRRTAMLIRVSERSFHGMEWRMPITNRFKG